MPESARTFAAAATPTSRDMALLLLGGSMLTSSFRKSETAAINRARRQVLDRAHHWRGRASSLSSGVEAMIGAAVVAYTIWQILRRELDVAEEALGIDVAGHHDDDGHQDA